jgi:CheY-like chemotaxis protein
MATDDALSGPKVACRYLGFVGEEQTDVEVSFFLPFHSRRLNFHHLRVVKGMGQEGILLVVENEPRDMKDAADSARAAGFAEVEGKTTPYAARVYLEDRLTNGPSLPDGILLDLDFGYESGYELLRFWHSNPKLRTIPLIVWSILGEEQKEMCGLFKVKQFVGKWEGIEALQNALKEVIQPLK